MNGFSFDRKVHSLQVNLLVWGEENFKDYPWRYTGNLWHALVAEIMLQRTNADQVKESYIYFTKKYSSPLEFLHSGDKTIFKSLGLQYRQERLYEVAREIVAIDNAVPTDRGELLELTGVGQYVASAIRSLHANIYDTIIDNNIVRFYSRYFGIETNDNTRRSKSFKQFTEEVTPFNSHREYNYALLDFTREICRYQPRCEECMLRSHCDYFNNNLKNI
ncbi:hypothetical protein [Halobacillus halophilus]|uniref:hypothetical protein n=1 Tax=Halobacillus halophilus TaxID=1570 RepID=UPI001CD6F981|nr:hypothetical protein [Halobacillus halophilus]MCA1011755.1 hypothetical protein [Halobacillus halophilus]